MHTPPPPPIRNAPRALWAVARSFLLTLHALFGAPEDIAFQHTLTLKPYRLMLSWIRVGEALMRRLVLIEAEALAKPNTRSLLRPQNLLVRKRARRLMVFTPDTPEDWRVSFRCFPRQDRRLRQAQADAGRDSAEHNSVTLSPSKGDATPSRFRSAWPLAERFEALIRVFNAPDRYAERLARRLYANATGFAALLRAPAQARHRIERYAALDRLCNRAAARFNSS